VAFSTSSSGNTVKTEALALKGENAFEIMQKSLSVEFQNSTIGPFITSINGVKAGEGEYWALYVNGEYAQKGISLYTIDSDLNIEWKLEKASGFS